MSKRQGKRPGEFGHPDWVEQQLSALRAALAAGRWPAGVDRLLADVSATAPLEEEGGDYERLDIVLDAALEGVDIASRYPRFYRRLLADAALRADFLDALAILDDSDALPAMDPEPAASRLPFSQSSTFQSLQEGWRLFWQSSVEELERVFGIAPEPGAELAWRGAEVEEGVVILIREKARWGDREIEALLEAALLANQDGDYLQPILVFDGVSQEDELQATVRWGDYVESAPVSASGVASLPIIPLDAIQSDGRMRALRLELTAA